MESLFRLTLFSRRNLYTRRVGSEILLFNSKTKESGDTDFARSRPNAKADNWDGPTQHAVETR